MKKLILNYHFWIIGVISFLLNSCSTKFKTVEKEGAKKIYNLQYGDHKRNVMDVFLPAQFSSEKPLVMIVHGGAWKLGRKEHMIMIQRMLYKNNIPSVAINYRLLRKGLTYKDQLADIEKAISKTNELSKSWHLKPNNLVLLGESAGAHLSLLYGYQNPEKVKKIISMSGPTDFYSENYLNSFYSKKSSWVIEMVVGEKFDRKNLSDKYKEASPVANVSNVPTLIFQGNLDHLVSAKQGLTLEKVLTEKNIPNKLVFMKNSGHTPRLFSKKKRDSLIFPNIIDWIEK